MARTACLAFALLLLLAAPASAALKTGDPAPLFTLEDVHGQSFSLENHVGPVSKAKSGGMVISFFASWCTPCRKELPLINGLVDEWKGKGIRAVIVNVKEPPAVVTSLLSDLNVTRPVALVDRQGSVAVKYQVRYLPTTFFIGKDGTIKDMIFGEIRSEAELRNSIDKLLK